MTPRCIGLTGPAGSGKDTLADTLDFIGYRVAKVAFADPIRRAVCAIARENESIFGRQFKDKPLPSLNGMSPRWAAIHLGMALRAVDEDFWVKHARRAAESIMESPRGIVVVFTDVRFPNEARLVRELGGVIVQVQRFENPFERPNHESERLDVLPDYYVFNDGTRSGIEVECRRLANQLCLPVRQPLSVGKKPVDHDPEWARFFKVGRDIPSAACFHDEVEW